MSEPARIGEVIAVTIPIWFCVGVSYIRKGLRNLKIAKGFRKENMAWTVGYLADKKFYRDKHIGDNRYESHWEKYWTSYHYTYSVNGKTYDLYGGTPYYPVDIPKEVMVGYQRSAPEHGIIKDLVESKHESTGDKQLLGGIACVGVAVLLLVLVLVAYFWDM